VRSQNPGIEAPFGGLGAHHANRKGHAVAGLRVNDCRLCDAIRDKARQVIMTMDELALVGMRRLDLAFDGGWLIMPSVSMVWNMNSKPRAGPTEFELASG
jgi:hypothetical protein